MLYNQNVSVSFLLLQKSSTLLILVRVLVKSNFLCYSIIYLTCAYENFPWVLQVTLWLLLTLLLDFQLTCNLLSDEKCRKEMLVNELGDLLQKDHPVIQIIIASFFLF